ncbi:hypothetical protein OKW36_000230 [Paraburkholderia sp. MM5482-R1]
MVTRTVRRTLSGLTSAIAQAPKSKHRIEHTVKSAQQMADEAWRRTTHGLHNSLMA